MTSVLDLIENTVDLDRSEYYAVILGESPSRGAKSPSLWNAAFEALGVPAFMHPMDVPPARLGDVVEVLQKDRRFMGGAVTMPHKIDILPFLDGVEEEARVTGAVNCLYRDGSKLCGANTDGAGAVWSLRQGLEDGPAGRTALLVGTGGAGFATAACLAGALGEKGTLLLANRTRAPAEGLAGRLEASCRTEVIEWPVSAGNASRASILVNCTSLGFETMKKDARGAFSLRPYAPLGPVDESLRVPEGPGAQREYLSRAARAVGDNVARSLEVLAAMHSPLVFDIIYQPRTTMLLYLAGTLGFPIMNGVSMNLEQAVIAFDKTVAASGLESPGPESIRRIMAGIW